MGDYQEKHSEQGRTVMQICPCFSTDVFLNVFQNDFCHLLSDLEKETPLQMAISLRNVNASYKTATPTWFSEPFLYLLFLRKEGGEEEEGGKVN